MIVITLTDCPPKLRGDLSKWLCEINTGVFVGNLSSRVRDALWGRVCENLRTGRATMVFHTNNEQQMDFRVHNTTWQPVDLDGIKLMRRPKAQTAATLSEGFSKAAQQQKVQRIHAVRTRARMMEHKNYTVIDLETSGIDPEMDEILELGAIRIRNGRCTEQFSALIQNSHPVSKEVIQLTGLNETLLQQQGIGLAQALPDFFTFLGTDLLVGHNISFDFSFLRRACRKYNCAMPANRSIDTLDLARKQLRGIPNYKLETIAKCFSLTVTEFHRALPDCYTTHLIYQKFNENQ